MKKYIRYIISSVLAAAMIILTASCENSAIAPTAQDKKVVMDINGNKVQYQEFRYYFLNNKRDIYEEGSVLTDEDITTLVSLSENNAKQHAALITMAEKYGAELTKEQRESIDDYVDNYRKNNFTDDEAYRLALEAQYMTDYLFREMSCESTLAENIIEKMKETGKISVDDITIEKAFEDDGLICIKEIYIAYSTEQMKDYSRQEAEDVLEKLMNGENFEELMREHSDYNEEVLSPEHGYYTTEYDALEAIWETAMGLAVGEYSRVVESPYGFHIIMRCEKDADYMNLKKDEILELCSQSIFWEEYYALIDSLRVEYTEYGKNLDLASLS